MEQSKSFLELAEQESKSVFNPDYTAEFQSYIQNSIRQSDSANREAIKSASVLVINC